MRPRPLPPAAQDLLQRLDAPRLVAHLTLTHDVAASLVDALMRRWPALPLDREEVRFGAAIHDAGKAMHSAELSGPGAEHEAAGERLLVSLGVAPELARFCRTHGQWSEEFPLEDLLVAEADTVWKGKRSSRLDDAVAAHLAALTGEEPWSVYLALDDILNDLARDAEKRLAWQGNTGSRG